MCYERYRTALYRQYAAEAARLGLCDALTPAEFDARAGAMLSGMEQVALKGEQGVLFYDVWQAEDYQVCDVPVYGYYAPTQRAAEQLFCLLAERLLKQGRTLFQLHLYAHDEQNLRLFSMLQFGYMAEKGLYRLPAGAVPQAADIRVLPKAEIEARWPEIWGLTHAIVRHLQQAPVFYPGNEFTEEVYREFFLDEGTRLFGAFSPEGQLLGIIEANNEADWFIPGAASSVNVGEAYVLPACRGTGLAHWLLAAAAEQARQQGAACLWVEHGTANPEARGFWGKYFAAYQYELVRKIDPILP